MKIQRAGGATSKHSRSAVRPPIPVSYRAISMTRRYRTPERYGRRASSAPGYPGDGRASVSGTDMEPVSYAQFSSIIGALANGEPEHDDIVLRRVATHSRRIHSGSAFFALADRPDDCRRWMREALKNGAAIGVARAGSVGPELLASGRVLEVDEPLAALHRLASWWRAQLTASVVAVVGSNGKTITKDALAYLLSPTRRVYASPGSYNSQLGVPLALLGCPATAEVAIVELAVNNPGEMDRLERIVRPDHVVLTNIGARWRSRFRDREQHTRELLSICRNLAADRWLLTGEQDPAIAAIAAEGRYQRVTRGADETVPRFTEPHYALGGLTVQAGFPDGLARTIGVRTPSAEILNDVELATCAAWLLGAPSAQLAGGLDGYIPTSTRTEIWRTPRGTTVIRDVATPDAIAAGSAIRAARRTAHAGGRLVLVLSEDLPFTDIAEVQALADVLSVERVERVLSLSGRFSRELSDLMAGATTTSVELFDSTDGLRRALEGLDSSDVALVQSAPSSAIGDLSSKLIESIAPTRLYIDLSAIEDNVLTFRRLVGPSIQLTAMVKALAYGTDNGIVASCLEDAGIDFLGVSSADEGVALRRAGTRLPILVMLGTSRDLDKLLDAGLTPVVYSHDMLDAVVARSRDRQTPIRVHVEFDTGMHRTGIDPSDARVVLSALRDASHVVVEGIMTHFGCSDEPEEDALTLRQAEVFEQVLAVAGALGLRNVIRHAASTAATIRLPATHFDMVRIGIGLHGLHPSPATRACVDLVPAFGLVSRIVEILELKEGDRIGYGGTYTVPAGGARVGVVPAGYHDCVPRDFSNVGHVNVAGVDCPILGRVSMDSMTIDLSACPDADVGSDVLILGRYADRVVAPELLADSINTIAYELMARLGPRVQRIITRH
jgi:Alr-MurF fusion protein